MSELWQLYNEDGTPIVGQGAVRADIYKGLLHAASHIWIWRNVGHKTQLLIQRRALDKRTWPNMLDIPAAGHIDLGETPLQAAIRETQEEIGLAITEDQLQSIGVHRAHLLTPEGAIENEFQFLYLLELSGETAFRLQEAEVASLEWMDIEAFKHATQQPNNFVPHGKEYFTLVINAILKVADTNNS